MTYLISFNQINLNQLYELSKLGYDIKFKFSKKYIEIYVSKEKEKEFKNCLSL